MCTEYTLIIEQQNNVIIQVFRISSTILVMRYRKLLEEDKILIYVNKLFTCYMCVCLLLI